MSINIWFREHPELFDIDSLYLNSDFDFKTNPPTNKEQITNLCANTNLTRNYIKTHQYINWPWETLLYTKLITTSDLERWNIPYRIICKRIVDLLDPDVTQEVIINIFTNTPMREWENILAFGKINIESIIKALMKMGQKAKPCWHYLSKNRNITRNILIRYCHNPWDVEELSGNKNISIEMILNDIQCGGRSWNWERISVSIKKEEYYKYRNHPLCRWCPILFTSNYNFDINDLQSMNLLHSKYANLLSCNKNIPFSFIISHPNWDWYRRVLSIVKRSD